MPPLTTGAWMVLLWLSKADSSPLGECQGFDLADLALRGLVEIGNIPPGCTDPRDRRVSVNEAGWAALAEKGLL